jgi:hypothetical protein
MKTNKVILITTLMVGTAATLLVAQENRPAQTNRPAPSGQRPTQSSQPPQRQGGPEAGRSSGGPGSDQMQRPSFPIVEALDANRDRVIDASEIANSVAALKNLDKNKDGKLTHDEFMPQRPGGGGGPGGQGSVGQSRPTSNAPSGQTSPQGGPAPGGAKRQRPASE